jgi:hypothetical protein
VLTSALSSRGFRSLFDRDLIFVIVPAIAFRSSVGAVPPAVYAVRKDITGLSFSFPLQERNLEPAVTVLFDHGSILNEVI